MYLLDFFFYFKKATRVMVKGWSGSASRAPSCPVSRAQPARPCGSPRTADTPSPQGEAVGEHLGSLFQAPARSWGAGRCAPGRAPERLAEIPPEARLEVDSFKLTSRHTEPSLPVTRQVPGRPASPGGTSRWRSWERLFGVNKPVNTTGPKGFVLSAVSKQMPQGPC